MRLNHCAECAAKDAVIAALKEVLAHNVKPEPTTLTMTTDRTRGCPCRPENGGSGICGCTLGGLQVVC